jgi:hypothetical protein
MNIGIALAALASTALQCWLVGGLLQQAQIWQVKSGDSSVSMGLNTGITLLALSALAIVLALRAKAKAASAGVLTAASAAIWISAACLAIVLACMVTGVFRLVIR